jgi:hypothetical protein
VNVPTTDEIRAWSTVRWPRFGVTDDALLQERINRAAAYVAFVTGQNFDAPTVASWATLTSTETLLRQAIQLRTEQITVQGGRGHISSAAENEVVQSFTAGSYSESRRDPARRGEQKSLNTWPALDELLWMLMTDERYGWWYAYITGKPFPATWVEEVEWRGPGTVALFEEYDPIQTAAVS